MLILEVTYGSPNQGPTERSLLGGKFHGRFHRITPHCNDDLNKIIEPDISMADLSK